MSTDEFPTTATSPVHALLYRAGFDDKDARVLHGTDPPVIEIRGDLIARHSFRVQELLAMSAKYAVPIRINPT